MIDHEDTKITQQNAGNRNFFCRLNNQYIFTIILSGYTNSKDI